MATEASTDPSSAIKMRAGAALLAVATLAVVVRLVAATRGHNFDYESELIVSRLVLDGRNVYEATPRYNYGPPFFLLLGALRWVGEGLGNLQTFRILLIGAISLADLWVAAWVRRRWGVLRALGFLFCPVSVIITGYHNQFDIIAIALGLASVSMLERTWDDPRLTRHDFAAIALLGLSLATKHLFFFLPVWLALRPGPWRRRAAVLVAPPLLFLVSFAPFAWNGIDGIRDNVFLYKSFQNQPLLHNLGLGSASHTVAFMVFAVALVVGGVLCRKHPPVTATLVYLIVLVVTSPSVANQYLAIPIVALVALMGWRCLPYVVLTTYFLMISSDGLHIDRLTPGNGIVPADVIHVASINGCVAALTAVIIADALLRAHRRRPDRRLFPHLSKS